METKPNEGVIFRNKKKQDGDKQPDWKGEIDFKGTKQEIAMWFRTSANGVEYFSAKLGDVWVKREPAQPPASDFSSPPPPLSEQEDATDSMPF